MKAESANLSPAKREALQSGDGESDPPVELALCIGKNLAGSLLPQQDSAAVEDLILRAIQRERGRR